MYQKILVPLDGSEFGECTLSHAKAIAGGCQAQKVVFLQVAEPIPQANVIGAELGDEFFQKADKETRAASEKYLSRFVDDFNRAGIPATAEMAKGRAADTILDYASKNNIDLIILSTHGSSGIVRWAVGSVADRVVRHSTVPVLVVAPKACRIS